MDLSILINQDEHLQKQSFAVAVHDVTHKQATWEKAYNATRRRLKAARSDGKEVNLIYTDSWFTRKRHLDKLPFNRLIFLDPATNIYTVLDGRGKGEA